jgi:hypothetical protein
MLVSRVYTIYIYMIKYVGVVILRESFVFHEDQGWTRPMDGVEPLLEVNFCWAFGNSY